jgi:hypothetical protein
MTPKEKAKELVLKFGSKTSALLCVDELLYFSDTQANGTQKGLNIRTDWIEYFNNVKHELRLL